MTVAFLCGNSAARALALIGDPPADVETVEIACGGHIDVVDILHAVERGADRVLVIVCHNGACRSLHGDEHAEQKVELAAALLAEISCLVPVQLHRAVATEPGRLRGVLLEGVADRGAQ